jgi:hypothetical protein
MDAITILVIREAQKGEDGIFVSYPDEIEANLLKALSYFHDYGSSKGIAERIR